MPRWSTLPVKRWVYKAMLDELGIKCRVRLLCDSSAAIGIASRTGLGKLRHLEVRLLWLQELVRDKRLTLEKVDGKLNVADALTKFCKREVLDMMFPKCHYIDRDGRAESAPALQGMFLDALFQGGSF